MADPEHNTPSSEAARLNRAGELAPADHLAVMYGKPARGRPRHPTSLKNIPLSEAALGYLMHNGKPVIDQDGHPVRLCEGLRGWTTHEALKGVLPPRSMPWKGRRSNRGCLLAEVAPCGQCHHRLFRQTSADAPPRHAGNATTPTPARACTRGHLDRENATSTEPAEAATFTWSSVVAHGRTGVP